ncbi:FAD-dependent oxidoreductase [Plastoroseomonas arctica]|uniref:FAD-dependent oxidoreductase n=1 Tax=Plastoroseomonas arctica TaxID=1509237 RepID=UPI001BA900BF
MSIAFDGRPISALPGESVGAALSAAGILALRRTVSGAERGLHCGMGACFDCLVTIDGRANQRACMVAVADGMVVESAAPAHPAPLAEAPGAEDVTSCDVLVVGSGVAGLAAAAAAARAGARTILLDEREKPGGQYAKPLGAAHEQARPDAQHRLGDALRAEAIAAGVTMLADAQVWGAFAVDDMAALVGGRAARFNAKRLVLATGAHEAPVPIPGWTLPGVMTVGGMQSLARAQRVSPATRVVIAGNGPLNLQLAAELVAGGVEVAAVVETAAKPGLRHAAAVLAMAASAPDLLWDGAQSLRRLRGVPIIYGATLLGCEADAAGHFAALRIATATGEQRVEAGACALNHGFAPDTALARALGCAQRLRDGRLETVADADGRTSDPAIFAVGDGASFGGARVALESGRAAGLAAARDLGFTAPEDARNTRALHRAEKFQRALWRLYAAPPLAAPADTTILCRCEEVTAGTLRAAMAEGAQSLPALKRATRAGMGRCQGRFCAESIGRLCGAEAEADFSAPRAPLRPVPIAVLAREHPEWGGAPIVAAPPAIAWRGTPSANPPTDCDVLVIGGGVAGLSTALYLARDGHDVAVLDRAQPGVAASTANAGTLHVQLLSYDIGDPAVARGGEGPAASALPLAPESIALWEAIARDAGEPLGLKRSGGLMLAETAEEQAWLVQKAAIEARHGIRTDFIGANELRDLAPDLGPHFIAAAFCEAEGMIDPLRATLALARLARAAGARIHANTSVIAIARDGGGFTVTTEAGTLRCGRIVNAAGPWAGQVAALSGHPIPVRGSVQQVLATEAAPPMLRHAVAHAGRHLSLKQGSGGHVLIGGGWPGTHDAQGATRNTRGGIEGNLWVAQRVLPALAGLHLVRAWTAMNIHLDGAPLLGETPGLPGFFNAVTFNGYTLAPIVGRMTADAMAGRAAIPERFSLARFA